MYAVNLDAGRLKGSALMVSVKASGRQTYRQTEKPSCCTPKQNAWELNIRQTDGRTDT